MGWRFLLDEHLEVRLQRLVHRDSLVNQLSTMFPGYTDTDTLVQGMKEQTEVVRAFFDLDRGFNLADLKRAAELAVKPTFNTGQVMMLKAIKNNVTNLLKTLGYE